MEASEVLRELAKRSHVSVNSTPALAGAAESAAQEDDEKRRSDSKDPLRRKTGLQPVHGVSSLDLTYWSVLHTLGRSMAIDRRGASRGLAEHWGSLKYIQALSAPERSGSYLRLSKEGKRTAEYYKVLQSKELGIAFGLHLAEQVLRARHADHYVSITPADGVFRSGWSKLGYHYRPQFFAEIWKPGEPSRVIALSCKGNHGNDKASENQLASASAHVEGLHIGEWDRTPALLFSTEIPMDGLLSVHALEAERDGGYLTALSNAEPASLDVPVEDQNIFPGITLPPADDDGGEPGWEPGFHVTAQYQEWFRRILARTAAAGLTAFAGDDQATVPYLTKMQGRSHFTEFTHAATGSVQDAKADLFGIHFVGTDHVFRLNGTRVEAFSGVAEELFQHLEQGRLERYRSEVYRRRNTWPAGQPSESEWDGPVSLRDDGTVLAIRLFAEGDTVRAR